MMGKLFFNMTNTQILDCTLRDGGYINDFQFGEYGIRKIISQLTNAGIDIIECGFLEDGEYDSNASVFNTVEQIASFIPEDRKKTMYVAMACYGEYNISQLSPYDGKSIDGIRVTFHYNEVEDALEYCRNIMAKGYKVFVQPVGTTSYTDEQLLNLIYKVNDLQPYAFYLVDTLGLMHKNDVIRFFYLIDHNLSKTINMGFHSHNNLQLSYSNCQALASVESNRTISLDSSVYGMGRGAGNLNTELIANYLNDHQNRRYEVEPILEVVDEFILKIKAEHEWGYSVPYYLAAINGCHPNYASHLSSKQTLTVRNIATILKMIEPEKRSLFNKALAEEKYLEFQSNEINDHETVSSLKSIIEGRNVMILAPGPSLTENQDAIKNLISEKNCVVIAVSFVPDFIETDYVFLSNLKRYNTTFNPAHKRINLIHTSNIKVEEAPKMVVNYSSLLNEEDVIRDNTSAMLLNLLIHLKPAIVFLAGLDGYKQNGNNYYLNRLNLQNGDYYKELNEAMATKVKTISQTLSIVFVTPSLYSE